MVVQFKTACPKMQEEGIHDQKFVRWIAYSVKTRLGKSNFCIHKAKFSDLKFVEIGRIAKT